MGSISRLDPRGRILYVNRLAAFLLGRDKRQLLRHNLGALLRPDDYQKFATHLRRSRRTVSGSLLGCSVWGLLFGRTVCGSLLGRIVCGSLLGRTVFGSLFGAVDCGDVGD